MELDIIEIKAPKGSIRYAHVYAPLPSMSDGPSKFSITVPLRLLPEALHKEVISKQPPQLSEPFIHLKSASRPPIDIQGLDIEESGKWLLAKFQELEACNRGKETIFELYPCIVSIACAPVSNLEVFRCKILNVNHPHVTTLLYLEKITLIVD